MIETETPTSRGEERAAAVQTADSLSKRLRTGGRRDDDEETVLRLVESLKECTEFEAARSLIEAFGGFGDARRNRDRPLFRELVFCTYMSEELPPRRRYRAAWDLLTRAGTFEEGAHVPARLLGLAGAVAKRQWESGGDRSALERSLFLYQRGSSEESPDGQYCSVNAAYVLDRLTALAEASARDVASTERHGGRYRTEGEKSRLALLGRFEKPGSGKESDLDLWYRHLSRGEALLGLGRLEEACPELASAAAIGRIPAWRFGSAVAQLGAVLSMNVPPDRRDSGATAVATALGLRPEAFLSGLGGKAGVALSGGGFRAALFHLGVLEALADADRLRRVEVLSCVSGGSIVGAIYYLHLRRLLEGTCDCSIEACHYRKVVDRTRDSMERLAASDLRARLFANPVRFLRTVVTPGWTRTSALAQMFGLELERFEPGASRLEMPGLVVEPKVCESCARRAGMALRHGGTFSPRFENWSRAAKVPILVLNATCLNTGHSWQFTASWAGEPPAQADTQLDAIPRLRRIRFRGGRAAGDEYRRPRLCEAVATSAAVPGLLAPATVRGYYRGVSVRLVDGGVHDNQGVGSLLDQGCSRVVISDASGQMGYEERPGRSVFSVPWRSNAVLQARVRELQIEDLEQKQRAGVITELVLVHLTSGLTSREIAWSKSPETESPALAEVEGLTRYGVAAEAQRALSRRRTDLDSFSPLERTALMESGRRLTESAIGARPAEPAAYSPGRGATRALQVGSHRLFKVTRLLGWRALPWAGALGLLVTLVAAAPVTVPAVASAWAAAPAWAVPTAVSLGSVLAGLPLLAWLKLGVVNRLYRRLSRSKKS